MSLVLVSNLPEKLPWREGTIEQVAAGEADYFVLDTQPQYGNPVRLRDATGESFFVLTEPGTPLTPKPNTPNNPYFSKGVLTGAQFIGLCIGVLGVVPATRVTTAPSFDAIKMWVLSEGVRIDPDDMAGQFLQLAGLPGGDGYLTTALALDGQPIMTRAQRDAIMAAWK